MSNKPSDRTGPAAWLVLNRAPGLGPRLARVLVERFGTAAEVLGRKDAELAAAGVPPAAREYLAGGAQAGVEADLAWLAAPGRHLLSLDDPRYPRLLRDIPDPPMVLFVQGSVESLWRAQVAIVGSRNPTPGAAETAFQFARALAGRGLTVTSGLALGIDGASHRGAVAADGFTVAVMGSGPDRVYPARHEALAAQIIEQGALVTEFPTGAEPRAAHFPRRNRIISGLSVGVLVVEAAIRSGSLGTARFALEQGREVMAIPGSIHNPMARGCHALIRQGAKLVETVDDVLEEIGQHLGGLGPPPSGTPAQTPPEGAPALDEDYTALLDLIDYAPTSVDILVSRSGLTAQAVSSMLLQLELGGFIASLTGGLYTRTPRNR